MMLKVDRELQCEELLMEFKFFIEVLDFAIGRWVLSGMKAT